MDNSAEHAEQMDERNCLEIVVDCGAMTTKEYFAASWYGRISAMLRMVNAAAEATGIACNEALKLQRKMLMEEAERAFNACNHARTFIAAEYSEPNDDGHLIPDPIARKIHDELCEISALRDATLAKSKETTDG
jgi:hypothetical protein